jgi:putative NADH-flavin reductase
MMNLLVLGASGRTGTEVVTQGLGADHHVTAFVHDPTKVTVTDPHLSVVAGDAMVPADLRSALAGQDAVISTLGSRRPADQVISTTTESLIETMGDTGVRRIVMMSNFAVRTNYRPSRLEKLRHPTVKTVVADMATAEALLRGSDLDWTIVRATRLANGSRTGRVRVVGAKEPVTRKDTIIRADVANFLLELLGNPDSIRQILTITEQP